MVGDLIVGAWQNGLSDTTFSLVEEAVKRQKSGFRPFPQEVAILELSDMLSGYDEIANELLTTEGAVHVYSAEDEAAIIQFAEAKAKKGK